MKEPRLRQGLIPDCRAWLEEHEFARFLIAGGINTVVTYFIYVGLVLFLPYPVAYTITTLLGIGFSYFLNARFVFRSRLSLAAAVRYPLVYAVQYVLGLALLFVLVEIAHLSKFYAPIFIVVVSVPVTFVLSRYVIRRDRSTTSDPRG